MPRNSRPKKGGKIRPSKSAEVKYKRELQHFIKSIWKKIKGEVIPVLKLWQGETSIRDSFVVDGYSSDMQKALENINAELAALKPAGEQLALSFVNSMANHQNRRFENNLQSRNIDPSLRRIIKTEQIGGALDLTVSQNADLITNMTDDYMNKIKRAINSQYLTGEFGLESGGLINELKRITGISMNRAELIATDQAHKLNAALNQLRSEEIGSASYIWRTADDERVRGNPSGKYPGVSKSRNHWIRDGKEFLWKPWAGSEKDRPIGLNGKKIPDPPKEGNPGEPVRCRCIAEPVFRD